MFHIETAMKAKVLTVEVLSQKNRQPDEDPGVKMKLELQFSNDMLSHFDGFLKGALFTKSSSSESARTAQLDGIPVVSDMPNLSKIGMKIGRFSWDEELTGYVVTIDRGLGGKSNLVVTDCILSDWKFTPKEGGTVIARVSIESSNVSAKDWGTFAKLKSRPVEILAEPPKVDDAQMTIEGAAGAAGAAGDAQPGASADPKDSPTGGAFPSKAKAPTEAPPQSATTEKPARGSKAKSDSEKAAAATAAFAGTAPH